MDSKILQGWQRKRLFTQKKSRDSNIPNDDFFAHREMVNRQKPKKQINYKKKNDTQQLWPVSVDC